ncbi:MAG TPA: sigma-54 dependent transcriptional regulator [Nitrospira sp.]|nr:sigma-54 dependent transcriptional regulator [Nitrospira sp.]
MAGSPKQQQSVHAFADLVLQARVDTIRLLAGRLSEQVAVMDRSFNVLYANEAGWQPQGEPAKCYQAFARRTDPCSVCPAAPLLEGPGIPPTVCAPDIERPACGMYQAVPLFTEQGDVGSILVWFAAASAAATLRPSEPATVRESERQTLAGLIGQSPVMQELFDLLILVADSPATVLVQGESGTGKELVAHTIHQLSGRRDKPFIVVDCGSLPETLLESELFGHVKGSFTGATAHKRGLFEEADGGTIFLDEIADTTPTFQAKLLRTLQEGEIRRVGGTHPIKIDVRVISATNKDLLALVKAKSFRHDLYYRLAVLPLHLPPLRDRREDIPLLVRHFAAVSCRRHHQPVREIPDDAMRAYVDADWPGNVRELQHCIERQVVTTKGPVLSYPESAATRVQLQADAGLRSVAREAAKHAEHANIVRALSEARGNRVKTAKLLKISRANLYNKLREHGLL